MTDVQDILKTSLDQLSEDVADLCLPLTDEVPELAEVPSSIAFLRDWSAPNKPFVVRGAAKHWQAVKQWTPEYFRKRFGDKMVTVAVTPNGYADAIAGDYFAMPEERKMPMAQFLDILEEPEKHNGVFYIQKQNSNLTDEFPELLDGVPADIPWMSEALDKAPDAVNFWMGDGRAVTSLHKDHYENIYCVISGHKDILLLPPTARPRVRHRFYPPATYREQPDGTFQLEPVAGGAAVPWADWTPPGAGAEAAEGEGERAGPRPLHCRLHAGDMLYLPALWFHHLSQSHGCVAVNYWYDMEFDLKFCYFKFLEGLSAATVDR